jgi:predicted dehydrogenase
MIRYAVVGAGWIAQEAFMPAVAATGNSRMQAIVSGSPGPAQKLADFHGVPEVVGYDDYDALIHSDRIDAVYIALPNSMHANYAIRALTAGKHVMVEKPLATTLAEGQAMIAAAKSTGALLMTAYRLTTNPVPSQRWRRSGRARSARRCISHPPLPFSRLWETTDCWLRTGAGHCRISGSTV